MCSPPEGGAGGFSEWSENGAGVDGNGDFVCGGGSVDGVGKSDRGDGGLEYPARGVSDHRRDVVGGRIPVDVDGAGCGEDVKAHERACKKEK